jgi:hypothetical protein
LLLTKTKTKTKTKKPDQMLKELVSVYFSDDHSMDMLLSQTQVKISRTLTPPPCISPALLATIIIYTVI